MINPYFSPFIMTDGSTRRPIVDRVPECRPSMSGVAWWPINGRRRIVVYSRGDNYDGIEPKLAVCLALCRVACEDWLRDSNDGQVNLHCTKFSADDYGVIVSEEPPEHCGQTIHHALVAAAHAVADANGIPH